MSEERIIELDAKKILLILIVIAISVSGVVAVTRFWITRPAGVTVVSNDFNITLTDGAGDPVTNIAFANVYFLDESGTESTTVDYIITAITPGGSTAYITWIDNGLPGGMTLTAQHNSTGSWEPWTELTEAIELDSGDPTVGVNWTVDVQSSYAGAYAFAIEISAGDT